MPSGVVIISLVGFVISFIYLWVLLAIIVFALGMDGLRAFNLSGYEFFLAILIFALPFLIFIMSLNLLKKKNWARISYLVFGFLLFFLTLTGYFNTSYKEFISTFTLFINLDFFVTNFLLLLFSILIIYYFLFNQKVKKYFISSKKPKIN